MRNCFASLMTEYSGRCENLVLLYADIGNRLFNQLKNVTPERTINAGIAEANMATVAAGLAMSGMKPFIYTITPFTTTRNLEQIKIDIAYQNLPVTIVGTGSGMAYANLGPTHHSFEDIAVIRTLPNMYILCPADQFEMEALFPQILQLDSPLYFRIGKKNEPRCYDEKPLLTIGKFNKIHEGETVALISTGTILPNVIAAGDELNKRGVSCAVISAHTVKPLDKGFLHDAASRYELIVSVEEHSLVGGFGSALCEYFIDANLKVNLLRLGLQDVFMDQMHCQETARAKAGLDVKSIVSAVLERLGYQ